MKNFYTYLVQCRDQTYYCGWTNDLEKRMAAHDTGKGAKYTKYRSPIRLVYFERSETKEEAMRREYQIKQLTRAEKEEMISLARRKKTVQRRIEKINQLLSTEESIR